MKKIFNVELLKLRLSLINFGSIPFKKRNSEILNTTLLPFLRYSLLNYGNRRFINVHFKPSIKQGVLFWRGCTGRIYVLQKLDDFIALKLSYTFQIKRYKINLFSFVSA